MNYVRHLNGFFKILEKDERMSAYHISLYLTCFQIWNQNRFVNPFPVSRMEMMRLSRIGSVNTYAKCMKELKEWGYVKYSPSSNMYQGSHLACIRFDTASNTTTDTASDTLLINSLNIKKGSSSFKKSRNKNGEGKNPLQATTEKDYAEPL
ncbi:hypothetical protein [Marinifilum sp. D714]|uniref:hypothetical protein n=1 Tax=Marinifilum sp. D714 TaxID=2937523 RepID=UPI0027C201EF|nr:hypothetical protein [Marinifilum sp. D714]MDQ2178578.1 hypothetical protein [Marinifilum sp. D714]